MENEDKIREVKKFVQFLEDNGGGKNHFDLSEILQAVEDYKVELLAE